MEILPVSSSNSTAIHKDGDGDALFQLKSDSLPHAHAQTTKTYYKHQDSRIKDKDFYTNSDIKDLPSKISIEKHTLETNEPKTARKENGASIIKDWVFESDEDDIPKVKTVEIFNEPSFAKINFVKSTEQVKSPRKTSVDKNRQHTPSPKGNKRNWNQQMSQKLGSDF
ncbi:hypothetical protein Tco_0718954 [Tanacetum coccineum]